jgi:DNA-directed RNA polymerase specialized sigma24 family protein
MGPLYPCCLRNDFNGGMKSTLSLSNETTRRAEKFQQMMETYHQPLFRYYALHECGDLQTAYELTAATFQLLYRKQESFERTSFRSELFGIAWDLLNAHTSCRNVRSELTGNCIEQALSFPLSRMLQSLRSLPFYPREIFYLRCFAGLSAGNIALLMDKNETTVKVIVYQAMLKFAHSVHGIETPLLPWKQLVIQAQAYDLYLSNLFAGVQPQQIADDIAVRVARELETLRESISMTPGMFSALKADIDRTIQNEIRPL